MTESNQLKWYQKPVPVVLLIIFLWPVGLAVMWTHKVFNQTTRLIITSIPILIIIVNISKASFAENYEQEVYGKYYTGDSYVNLNPDKTWSWVGDYGESIANGTYKISYKGKWFNGPKYWMIDFNIKYEKYPNSFDPEQGVYYHDYNQITGERNYYRLNGMMPSTGASTDFIKR